MPTTTSRVAALPSIVAPGVPSVRVYGLGALHLG